MRYVPHWLRERTAEERAWERVWLRKMQAFERIAMLQDSARPYVTARAASAVLGVPQSVVEADVRRVYPLDCLIGAESGGVVYVSAWELEGERLAAHRERLRAVGDSGVEVFGLPLTEADAL